MNRSEKLDLFGKLKSKKAISNRAQAKNAAIQLKHLGYGVLFFQPPDTTENIHLNLGADLFARPQPALALAF